MKTCCIILRIAASVAITLFSLLFAVLESTLLLTGDFLLYEHAIFALLQLCLRVCLPTAALVVGIRSLIRYRQPFVWEGVYLLLSTAVTAPRISNGIGSYTVLLAAWFLAAQLLCRHMTERYPTPEKTTVDDPHGA